MSDGSLSQDEIDALLSGSGLDSGLAGPPEPPALSPQEIKELERFLSGVVASQASNLSGMVGKSVNIQKPEIELVSKDEFLMGLPEEVVEVRVDFQEGISGLHSYLFTPEIAVQIASLMMGQEGVELNEAALSALEEAGNTIAGSMVTALSDKVGKNVLTTPVKAELGKKIGVTLPTGTFIKVSYGADIDGENGSDIIEIFPIPVAQAIIGDLGVAGGVQAPPKAAGPAAGGKKPYQAPPQAQMYGESFGQPVYQQPQGMPLGGMMGMAPPNVQPVQFPNLTPQGGYGDQGNIGLLMDVYMEMTVELGRTRRLIKDILGMGEGTIIELDKLAGEPVDILVNHKLIAKGEVVVIDENFGVRVTEIVSPMERMSEIS